VAEQLEIRAFAGERRLGEKVVEPAEVVEEAEAFDLVVDQRDGVGGEQFLGEFAQSCGCRAAARRRTCRVAR
jgi:hypothetical protein